MASQIQEKRLLPNALGSATAGIISRMLTHPLDTIKAKLQAPYPSIGSGNSKSSLLFRGPLDVFQKTFQKEGVAGFYRGFGAILVGGTPGTIVYLCSYDILKQKFSSYPQVMDDREEKRLTMMGTSNAKSEFLIHFSAGMLAEAITCLIYVPVDVIKERLQIQSLSLLSQNPSISNSSQQQLQYRGSWDALTKIMKTEGLGGIYKGYGATLASFGPFSALYFVFYEQFKDKMSSIGAPNNNYTSIKTETNSGSVDNDVLSFNQLMICSASAGALASWITSPLDMAKLRLQVQRRATTIHSNSSTDTTELYKGMWDCLRKSYVDGGISGLFRGAGARVLHFTPATAITMTFYEKFRNFYADRIP